MRFRINSNQLLIILILIMAAAVRIFLINRDSVPFALDMGRDLLWAKDITFYKIPTLIGPAGSIWGVYFGPLWFYFLSIPLYLTSGNPLSAVYATASTIILSGLLSYFLFKKYLKVLYAFLAAIMILFNSTLINISTFAFHANILPLLTLLMLYFTYLAIIKNPAYIAIAFLSTSLMFHADPAPAVVNTLVLLIIFVFFKLYRLKPMFKIPTYCAIAFLVPFIPQTVFEVRNNFIQTKSLIAYFIGQNPSLSGQLPPVARIVNRLSTFYDFYKVSFAGGNDLFAKLSLLIVFFGIFMTFKKIAKEDQYQLFKLVILSIVSFFLIFTLVITVEVKNWYLYGLTVNIALLIVLVLYALNKYKMLTSAFLFGFLIVNLAPFISGQRSARAKSDPATLSNQTWAIERIYDDRPRSDFAAYVFTPSIYDYQYQYLFWWYGIEKKKGLPADFAYLPNQPDYVRNKEVYAPVTTQSNLIYLIIENSQENEFYTRESWLKNFQNYKLVWQENINNAIYIQKRIK